MDRQTDKEIADNLLVEWHLWTELYRPNLGTPRVSPYCKDSRTSKQYDDPADLIHDKVYQNEMLAVDYCIDAIAVPMQQAIAAEMKNRELKSSARVWKSSSGTTYAEALFVIMPIMKKKGLFD